MSIHHLAASKFPKITSSPMLLPKLKRTNSLSELSIGQLKMALHAANVSWSDCVEKDDLVRKLRHTQVECVEPANKTFASRIECSPELEHVPVCVKHGGKTVDISAPISWKVSDLKQHLFSRRHTKLVPLAQKLIVRGRVLGNDQSMAVLASKKCMLLRDHSHKQSEVSITFTLPSNRPAISTYSDPHTTVNQLKQLLQRCHNFPDSECYSICKDGFALRDEQSIKSFCSDDSALLEDGTVNIGLQIIPTMLLKLRLQTEVAQKQPELLKEKDVGSTTTGATSATLQGLVPSKMSTGLKDTNNNQRAAQQLQIHTKMEVIQPPHTVLETVSKEKSAQFALSLIEQDMKLGAPWTKILQQALQGAVLFGSRYTQRNIPTIKLPVNLVHKCIIKVKENEKSRLKQQKEQDTKRSTAGLRTKSRGISFTRGFLSESSKDRKRRRKQREEKAQKATTNAILSARSTAAAAAEAATTFASKAEKLSEKRKRKRRKFKSLMADLIAPTVCKDRDQEQHKQRQDEKKRLILANPKIESRKLEKI